MIFVFCGQIDKTQISDNSLTEFSKYYSEPTSENMYSQHIQDSFRLFKMTPQGYGMDSMEKYPLILILDANAFFESTVSELKFNTFIGLIPKSIVVGIGYKDIMTMDSLQSRDYSYSTAIPEYKMNLSGGADKFKKFIDQELIPKLTKEFNIDIDRSVLFGHSLGAYFTLFYAFKSIEENSFLINNMVSASPSLHYNHRYLFQMEKNLDKLSEDIPLKLYISMGSEDMTDDESKGILDAFEQQITERLYKGLKIKKAEYSNFGHLDAAIPGFMKGLTYCLGE